MEHLDFVLPGGERRPRAGHWTIAGVVASGNLEILIEPANDASCHISIDTSADGFGEEWREVLEHAITRHGIGGVRISISDGGATPPVVGLRLDQAILNALEG